jgi:hypothetical protein
LTSAHKNFWLRPCCYSHMSRVIFQTSRLCEIANQHVPLILKRTCMLSLPHHHRHNLHHYLHPHRSIWLPWLDHVAPIFPRPTCYILIIPMAIIFTISSIPTIWFEYHNSTIRLRVRELPSSHPGSWTAFRSTPLVGLTTWPTGVVHNMHDLFFVLVDMSNFLIMGWRDTSPWHMSNVN